MMFRRALIGIALGASLATSLIWSVDTAYALNTVPLKHVYNGHILSATGNMDPITTSVDLRFSFWTSQDFVSGNVTGTGAIDTSASTFAGYAEEFLTVTPNSLGYFTVELGSGTALPGVDTQPTSTLLSEFLQVEVKTAGAADTAYEFLDINPSNTSIDRSPILSVPFAQNSDFVDQREPGTASGDIALLQSGAVFDVSHIPGGTHADSFIIDFDNTNTVAGNVILQFGNTISKTIRFDVGTGTFIINDDVLVQGDLEATGIISGSTIHAADTLSTSGALIIQSTISGAGLVDCDGTMDKLVYNATTQRFECATDESGSGLSLGQIDDRFVEIAGDTMTGQLSINQEDGTVSLSASGTIQTQSGIILNQDRGAGEDALLIFGNVAGDATLSFNNDNQYFKFDHDVNIQGDISISGTINNAPIESFIPLLVSSGGGLNASVNSGSYRLNGNTTKFVGSSSVLLSANSTNYLFFTSTGLIVNTSGFPTTVSYIPLGQVITDGASVTNITDRRALQTDDREQTLDLVFHPEYAGAAYAASGSSSVGRLTIMDTGSGRNFYSWTSTKPTLQTYDVVLRVAIPSDYVRFTDNPLKVTYRSSGALTTDNRLDIEVFDSSLNPVTLSGTSMALAGTDWATTELEFLGSPTFTPGGDLLVRYSLSARNNFQMHLGETRITPIELRSQ